MELSGPTFDDLSIDDNLSQLERVVKYSTSSIALQRLVHVKMLAETAATIGFEDTVRHIVPLFHDLSRDSEYVVRQHLSEQMEPIAKTCASSGKDRGYRLILETILPILSQLLGDSKAEVRQTAGEALVGVAALMKPSDLGQYVLTIVLQLAHDDVNEEVRMTAAGLLNDLAEMLGPDLCRQFVTPEMVSLGEDNVFRVRKATALSLHHICRVVGAQDSRERLLPTYIRLTKDDMYRVRKACTESLVDMAKALGPEVSFELLTDVFVRLAGDNSRVVRNGALQHLGPFISALPGDKVTAELVAHFTQTASAGTLAGSFSSGDRQSDDELRLYCAFSFPAVVLTLGPDRWDELKETYRKLTKDQEWSVRKTLSHSLHEIAKVLTRQQVEEDLVPEMKYFLQDIEEVRVGIIRRLAAILSTMSPACREAHLHTVGDISHSTSAFNWRLREILAGQLPQVVGLFTYESTFNVLAPLTFKLLTDPVCVVRETAFDAVSSLIKVGTLEPAGGEKVASIISQIREFAHASSYSLRQMYIYICQRLPHSMPREDFEAEFMPSLADLAQDRVLNVRIALARTFGTGNTRSQSTGAESSTKNTSCNNEHCNCSIPEQQQYNNVDVVGMNGSTCTCNTCNCKDISSSCSNGGVNKGWPAWIMEHPLMQRALKRLSEDPNPDVHHFMSLLPETYMSSLRNLEDKVMTWVETSSCVSDESTRTQWSAVTQRSELNTNTSVSSIEYQNSTSSNTFAPTSPSQHSMSGGRHSGEELSSSISPNSRSSNINNSFTDRNSSRSVHGGLDNNGSNTYAHTPPSLASNGPNIYPSPSIGSLGLLSGLHTIGHQGIGISSIGSSSTSRIDFLYGMGQSSPIIRSLSSSLHSSSGASGHSDTPRHQPSSINTTTNTISNLISPASPPSVMKDEDDYIPGSPDKDVEKDDTQQQGSGGEELEAVTDGMEKASIERGGEDTSLETGLQHSSDFTTSDDNVDELSPPESLQDTLQTSNMPP